MGKNKLNNPQTLQSFIHDMKTPLGAIKHGVIGLKIFLPKLLDAYSKAKEAKLPIEKIQPHQLELLYKVLNHLETSTDLINEQIDNLNK